jgi:hypothetical protein
MSTSKTLDDALDQVVLTSIRSFSSGVRMGVLLANFKLSLTVSHHPSAIRKSISRLADDGLIECSAEGMDILLRASRISSDETSL